MILLNSILWSLKPIKGEKSNMLLEMRRTKVLVTIMMVMMVMVMMVLIMMVLMTMMMNTIRIKILGTLVIS